MKPLTVTVTCHANAKNGEPVTELEGTLISQLMKKTGISHLYPAFLLENGGNKKSWQAKDFAKSSY